MNQRAPRWIQAKLTRFALTLIVALALAACGLGAPQSGTPTAAPGEPQTITIEAPTTGAAVSSPIVLQGRTAVYPFEGSLAYRVFDSQDELVGTGSFQVVGDMGQPGTFSTEITYTTMRSGPGRIEVVEFDAADGSIRAIDSVVVTLTANQPTPTVVPTETPLVTATLPPGTPEAARQEIVIETPPPGTTVGSPVVLTGRTSQFPLDGNLTYRIVDSSGAQLGGGSFNVNGAEGQPATFNASLIFTLPPGGGRIRAEVFDQDDATGTIIASTTLEMTVAPPASPTPQAQTITIETPPPGTVVGSPVVLTGRTSRYPFQGTLDYRIIGQGNSLLGEGAFPVSGPAGQAATFNASLTFNLPAGGPIRIEIFDQNAADGSIAGSTAIDLTVAPPPSPTASVQMITIETPPPGTVVGSPVVLTGRADLYPANGELSYRVRDANGSEIGAGTFQVNSPAGQIPATFNASLTFDEPDQPGRITIEIYDRDQQTGTVLATTSIGLRVEPPQPATATPTTTGAAASPTATTQPTREASATSSQAIRIVSPEPGAEVTRTLTIAGEVARAPEQGQLGYRVSGIDGTSTLTGTIPIEADTGPISFTLTLNIPAPARGPFSVEINERAADGTTVASDTLDLVLREPQP